MSTKTVMETAVERLGGVRGGRLQEEREGGSRGAPRYGRRLQWGERQSGAWGAGGRAPSPHGSNAPAGNELPSPSSSEAGPLCAIRRESWRSVEESAS